LRRVFSYCWFVLVMRLTGFLPDIRPVRRLRGWLTRPCFKSCGKRLELCHGVIISSSHAVAFGNDVSLTYGVWLSGAGGITFEDEVMLGPYTCVASTNHSKIDGSYRFGPDVPAPIVLGRGCWTGAQVCITSGVRIGAGALCAAGAVVTRHIPPHAVAGGVPAKVLGFTDENGAPAASPPTATTEPAR
jgi:maltose O-acetyltransferase